MTSLRRRAMWFAAAVSVVALATAGSALLVRSAASAEPGRTSVQHVVIDHDAVVSARPLADRSSLDLRQDHSKLLLLAWVGVLLFSALVARTVGRILDVGSRRARCTLASWRQFDRGPPALVHA